MLTNKFLSLKAIHTINAIVFIIFAASLYMAINSFSKIQTNEPQLPSYTKLDIQTIADKVDRPLVDAITKRTDNGQPELVTEGSSLETIRHMVASGLGITVLPLSAATAIKYQEDILAVRPFAPPVPFRTVALAWRVTFPRPKAIDVLSLAASQCRVMEKAKTATPVVAERA